MGHLVKGGTPFILGTFLLKNTRNLKIKVVLYSLVIGLFTAAVFQSIWWIRFNDQRVQIADQTLNLNSKYPANSTKPSAESLKRSVTFLQENPTPTEPVLALPYMAGLIFCHTDPAPPSLIISWLGLLLQKKNN